MICLISPGNLFSNIAAAPGRAVLEAILPRILPLAGSKNPTQGGHKKGHSENALTLSEHRKLLKRSGSSGWTRTSNPPVNSRMLAALRRENKKKD